MGEPEAETNKKPSSNRSAKDRRNTLFRVLDGVLSLSHRKIHSEGNSDKAKQGWARVMVSAVSTYGGILKDEELGAKGVRARREAQEQHTDSETARRGQKG